MCFCFGKAKAFLVIKVASQSLWESEIWWVRNFRHNVSATLHCARVVLLTTQMLASIMKPLAGELVSTLSQSLHKQAFYIVLHWTLWWSRCLKRAPQHTGHSNANRPNSSLMCSTIKCLKHILLFLYTPKIPNFTPKMCFQKEMRISHLLFMQKILFWKIKKNGFFFFKNRFYWNLL